MRIALCKGYGFYADAPDDLNVGDTVFVQIAKDKRTTADVTAIGEYSDNDEVIRLLLAGKPKKEILGRITMFKGERHE